MLHLEMKVFMQRYVYIHIYIHTYIHTYTYLHTYGMELSILIDGRLWCLLGP